MCECVFVCVCVRALLPCLIVWSSLPSLLTCCFLLVRGIHNKGLEEVEDGESCGEEEEDRNLDFPSSHKPEEDGVM